MANNKIEPNIILTYINSNLIRIPIIITNNMGEILTTTHIDIIGNNDYHIRKNMINTLDILINEYSVDTILTEQNQLFIDKIEKYPDPFVLRNICLGFGVKVAVEDNYWEKIPYLMEIPRYEWKKEVLNKKADYAIDLYKSHILHRHNLQDGILQKIDDFNYYEALCLSESMLHSRFLNKKYQVNS